MLDLTSKTALVTGSTQGIGLAIARALAAQGATVWVHCSRDEEKAKRVAEELGNARFVTADLSAPDAVERLYAKTGDVDILVANASVQYREDWDKISPEQFDTQVNVNLRSTLQLMQTYIPAMQKKKWGRFLAVGSVQQYKPHPQMAVYAATKCAIQSLVENVAAQVAADGVTVNNLLPGVIDTPRNDAALNDPVYAKQVLEKIPCGYAGKAEDCAAAALLLCSEEGRYVTGIALPVDGGMRLK